jgi:hypothetical protein
VDWAELIVHSLTLGGDTNLLLRQYADEIYDSSDPFRTLIYVQTGSCTLTPAIV